MNRSRLPARLRHRTSVCAASKIMLIVLLAIITLAAATLFYEWRVEHAKDKRAEKAGVGKIHSPGKKGGEKDSGKKKKGKPDEQPAAK